jgi:hypothetical protein
MSTNAFKILGILDGCVIAAITQLGTSVPSTQAYCHAAVIGLGLLGTFLGGYAHVQSKKVQGVKVEIKAS